MGQHRLQSDFVSIGVLIRVLIDSWVLVFWVFEDLEVDMWVCAQSGGVLLVNFLKVSN